MLTQDARIQRRLAHRRRVRRRRFGIGLLLAVGLALGLFFGLGSRGKSTASPTQSRPNIYNVVQSNTAIGHGGVRRAVHTRLTLPPVLPHRTLHVPILMYHRIDVLRPSLPAITRALTVAPNDFTAQMRWLHSHGFHAISQKQLFAALERGTPLPPRPVMITFDDGYRDVLKYAAPVLRQLGLHGTAYVITSRISGSRTDPTFLTWPELNALQESGIEIGSHTVHHAELPGLSDPAALQELIRSRHALELHLHHPVQWFAYPAGRFDARTEALVRQAGYVLAVTTEPGSTQDARAPFALHRYEVQDTTGVSGIASFLS